MPPATDPEAPDSGLDLDRVRATFEQSTDFTIGLNGFGFILGAAAVAVLIRAIGVKIVVGATESDEKLGLPVSLYVLVISLMVAFAAGTDRWWAIGGAALFYASDALIGWSRFIKEFPGHRLAIMTTYHLGQVGIVLGLMATT